MSRANYLGSILVRQGAIGQAQLQEVLRQQQLQGGRLGELLLQMGICSEGQIARALAEQLGSVFVDLEETPPARAALQSLPLAFVRQWGVVPAARQPDQRLVIVALDPFDFNLDAALRRTVRSGFVIAAGVPSQIKRVLDHYEELLAGGSASVARGGGMGAGLQQPSGVQRTTLVDGAAPSPDTVTARLARALADGAEGIEIALDGRSLNVFKRHAGELQLLATLPLSATRISISAPEAGEDGARGGFCQITIGN